MFISSFTQTDQWLHIINACTFDLINWTNAGKLKNYNDATLNNNRLGLIEQSVVKTKAFFVVIFQKTNKQKRSLTRQFVSWGNFHVYSLHSPVCFHLYQVMYFFTYSTARRRRRLSGRHMYMFSRHRKLHFCKIISFISGLECLQKVR